MALRPRQRVVREDDLLPCPVRPRAHVQNERRGVNDGIVIAGEARPGRQGLPRAWASGRDAAVRLARLCGPRIEESLDWRVAVVDYLRMTELIERAGRHTQQDPSDHCRRPAESATGPSRVHSIQCRRCRHMLAPHLISGGFFHASAHLTQAERCLWKLDSCKHWARRQPPPHTAVTSTMSASRSRTRLSWLREASNHDKGLAEPANLSRSIRQ